MFVKPKNNARVRHEDGRLLNPDGEEVERNSYWLRRINDGDVTNINAPEATITPTTKKDTK